MVTCLALRSLISLSLALMLLFAGHFGFILLLFVLPTPFPGRNFYQFTVNVAAWPALRLKKTSVKVQEREFYSAKYKDCKKKNI